MVSACSARLAARHSLAAHVIHTDRQIGEQSHSTKLQNLKSHQDKAIRTLHTQLCWLCHIAIIMASADIACDGLKIIAEPLSKNKVHIPSQSCNIYSKRLNMHEHI